MFGTRLGRKSQGICWRLDVSDERDRGSGMIPSFGRGGQTTGSMDESASELGGTGQATGLEEKSGLPLDV